MAQTKLIGLVEQILETASRQGIDQRELAERAGLSYGTVSRLKRQSDASWTSLSRLASAAGLRLVLVADDDYIDDVERGVLF